MHVIFSKHADLKIAQRKLSRQAIRATIESPDRIILSDDRRERLIKKFTKNYLHVIVKRENTTIIVITAHWVARPPKAG